MVFEWSIFSQQRTYYNNFNVFKVSYVIADLLYKYRVSEARSSPVDVKMKWSLLLQNKHIIVTFPVIKTINEGQLLQGLVKLLL